jgi:hypothetical protein
MVGFLSNNLTTLNSIVKPKFLDKVPLTDEETATLLTEKVEEFPSELKEKLGKYDGNPDLFFAEVY